MCTKSKGSVHRTGSIWGYLGLGFEDAAFRAVTDTHHHPLGHSRPPKSLLEQAQCVVPALVYQITVAPIYRSLALQSWHYKYQDIFVTPFRRHPQIKEVTPEYEVLLAWAAYMRRSASGMWYFRY